MSENDDSYNHAYWISVVRILVISIAGFSEGNLNTVQGPVYPIVAEEKGVTQTWTGIASAVNYLGKVVCSIVIILWGRREYRNKYFIFGGFISGLSFIVFSQVERLGKVSFVILSIVSRFLAGMGSAAVLTATTSTMLSIEPAWQGAVACWVELVIGFGEMAGPPLGSWLYTVQGLALPLFVSGCFEIVSGVLGYLAAPRVEFEPIVQKGLESASMKMKSSTNYIFYHGEILVGFMFATVTSSFGYVGVALAPYLEDQYSIGPDESELYFTTFFGASLVAAFLAGITLTYGFGGQTYILAPVFSLIGNLILAGPLVCQSIETKLSLLISLIFTGSATTCALVPYFMIAERTAQKSGKIDMSMVKIYIGAGLNVYLSIGFGTGQVLAGGLIYQFAGFYISSLFQAIMVVVTAVPAIYYMHRKGLIVRLSVTEEEKTPLLAKQPLVKD